VELAKATGVRAVLLDALGTLVELQPPAPALRSELSRRFGVELSEIDCERAIAAEISYYRGHLDEGRDVDSVATLRRHCASALHEALPRGAQRATADLGALTDALLASLRFAAYADAAAALPRLHALGLRLVVVSNWDFSLHGVLERVGLSASLDGIITSAEAGERKPSPAIFERALALAEVGAAEATHVGDSLKEDVAGARAAGIEPLLLQRERGASAVAGVRTIASLGELV
jgi:putative hydrolase of the HAD superfamily